MKYSVVVMLECVFMHVCLPDHSGRGRVPASTIASTRIHYCQHVLSPGTGASVQAS